MPIESYYNIEICKLFANFTPPPPSCPKKKNTLNLLTAGYNLFFDDKY